MTEIASARLARFGARGRSGYLTTTGVAELRKFLGEAA